MTEKYKMERSDFENMIEKGKEKTLSGISRFFERHGKEEFLARRNVDWDGYYKGDYVVSRLIDEDGEPTNLYVFDRKVWCGGCESNCGRVYNDVDLTEIWEEYTIKKLQESALAFDEGKRDDFFYAFLNSGGHTLLELETRYENSPKKVRKGSARAYSSLDTGYEGTLDLVNKIRHKK
jgi:hypothetical protein